jgi:hypothetical protein
MLNSQKRLYTLSGHVFLEIILHCYTINLNCCIIETQRSIGNSLYFTEQQRLENGTETNTNYNREKTHKKENLLQKLETLITGVPGEHGQRSHGMLQDGQYTLHAQQVHNV